jgi:hypothetical protein
MRHKRKGLGKINIYRRTHEKSLVKKIASPVPVEIKREILANKGAF